MNEIKITYRGWPGHYIMAPRCIFRLNTLIELENWRIVVSTVGNLRHESKGNLSEIDTIGGGNRYYETMAFWATEQEGYWEADVTHGFSFESPWAISAKTPKRLPNDVDTLANDMHEAVVKEVAEKLTKLAVEIPF